MTADDVKAFRPRGISLHARLQPGIFKPPDSERGFSSSMMWPARESRWQNSFLAQNALCPPLRASRDRFRWAARVNFKGKTIFLGDFETPEVASAAYAEAKRLVMEMAKG